MSPNESYASLRVLIVDDDELILKTMTASLGSLGLQSVTAESDGERFLDSLKRTDHDFDVILCDLNMPNVDGLTLLRHLASCNYPGFVILMSGEDRRILNAAATLAGALALKLIGAVTKPVTRHSLHNILTKAQRYVLEEDSPKHAIHVSEEQLRLAIANNELETFYQPKVSAEDRTLKGAEALVRWRSPELGLVAPNAFIPVAEKTGLVSDIFDIVVSKLIHSAGDLHRSGYNLSMSVNLSVSTLDRLDLPEFLADLTTQAGLSPDHVILELTESQLMADIFYPLEILCRAAMMGFRLSVDDFGTGFSSMSKLTTFPFHELKIDREFVNGAASDEIARTILETSTLLGQKLDMSVVAEGVETQEDWDVAATAGVNLMQGYFVAKPMPLDEFRDWVADWRP